jgi:hypothetical protein
VAAHLACNQEAGVRFSAPPPNPPGRPLRSRRWPETPDKHVRLVPLAPTLAVAQWQSGGLWPRPREFDSLRSPHFVRLAAGRGQTIAAESWGPRTAAQSVGRSVSGKPPVFEAGFECSIHSLPAIAGSFSGRTLLSDSRCRWVRVHPRQPFFLRAHRSKERTPGYEPGNYSSTLYVPTNRPFVQCGQDAALRKPEFRFESGVADQEEYAACRTRTVRR